MPADKTLAEQISEAFENSGMRPVDIMKLSGLDIDHASLSRKLRCKQKMWTHECEALARVLGVVVSTGKRAA